MTGEELRTFLINRRIIRTRKRNIPIPSATALTPLAEAITSLQRNNQLGEAMAQKARRKLETWLLEGLPLLAEVTESEERVIALLQSWGVDATDCVTRRAKLEHIEQGILSLAVPVTISLSRSRDRGLARDRITRYARPTVEINLWPDTRPGAKAHKGWHSYGKPLADLFCEAMRTVDQDYSSTGDVSARFLQAIIREISGEHAEEGAISGYLSKTATS